MIGAVLSLLEARWDGIRPGCPPPVSGIVIGADRDPAAKVTILFLDRSGRAAAVVKVSRERQGEKALRREHALLTRLCASCPPWLRSQLPDPLGLLQVGPHLVLTTSPVPGQPLRTRYFTPGHVATPRRVQQDFAMVGSWLATLHRETTFAAPAFGEATVEKWVHSVIERYQREVGWSAQEEQLFRSVRERALDLFGCRVPLVVSHGDLAIGNVMVVDGHVRGLIDWERAELARPPFRDIYKFPTSYGMYLDRAAPGPDEGAAGHPGRARIAATWSRYGKWRNLAGLGYAYFGSGWFPDLVRRYVLGHFNRLGIPHAANGVFFPVFLAEEAMSIPDPAFRAGYRSALRALADRDDPGWVLRREVAA